MPRGGLRPGAGRPRKNPEATQAQLKKARAPKKKVEKKGFTGPKGEKTPDAPDSWPFGTKPPAEPVPEPAKPPADPDEEDGLTDEQRAGLAPLEYLLAVMRSPKASKSARMQAAIQAAPYMHAKPAPIGKKEGRQNDAKKVASRFSAGAPPKLAAVGGKRIP
jgi:hypothetical protein